MTDPSSHTQKLPVSIQDEMRTSYLDYAMSVIIGRAIPDVRDGLKPVHRRILYSMYDQKFLPSGSTRKCAAVVGDVLGRFHPHGDSAVYDALVRLAQSWSMRYPLIDPQGNFGSIDGSSAAAYRYTEARLAKIAMELLTDLDKECVDFLPNFDDHHVEPTVLPARIPNLLVNGSGGIAVGMATNVPPHNLREIIDATVHLIRNKVYGRAGIVSAQRTGRGTIVMRARMTIEKQPGKGEREQVVVTEVPYQANPARIVSKLAELRQDKKIEGIVEGRDGVRDEGDKDDPVRIVIELKKDAVPQVVINQLYRMTELQSTFGVINLAIAGGRPAVLNLRETLSAFIEHRREVVTRRTRFELRQAEGARELNEGLGVAVTDIDRVISTIRAAKDSDEAREALMKLPLHGLEAYVRRAGRPQSEIDEAKKRAEYYLSERQARAILDMRLARLTGLEADKLATEYAELCSEIARLRAILADEKLLFDVIIMELEEIKEKYGDKRRTEIVETEADISEEDLIKEEEMVVTISHAGYIKRTATADYRAQRRGGRGKIGMEARDEDWVTQLFIASTHAYVFFFSDRGKVYVKKVFEIPLGSRTAKGRAIVNFVGMESGEKIAAIVEVPKIEAGKYVVTLTKRGQIKKTELLDYENFREKGIIGVKIEENDQLLSAGLTDGEREILIATKMGQSIRFPESQVRSMGRATMGVKAIDVGDDDSVVGLAITDPERAHVLAVCENGYGKRTNIEEFRIQNRGGKGIILIDASDRNGPVVDLKLVNDHDELMLITNGGQTIRTRVDEIRETGRNAQGVKLMTLGTDERVVGVERLAETDAGQSEMPPPDGSIPPGEGGGGTGETIPPPPPAPEGDLN